MSSFAPKPMANPHPPVAVSVGEEPDGAVLCLSGGGFRAMLFHLGAILRLNDARLLPQIELVSCVSGGSVTGAMLALRWAELRFDDTGYATGINRALVEPILALSKHTLDVPAICHGLLDPRATIGGNLAAQFSRCLYGEQTFGDLGQVPQLVVAVVDLERGLPCAFSNRPLSDERREQVGSAATPISVAVAASISYPPMLPGLRLSADGSVVPKLGSRRARSGSRVLIDGGAMDNLALEFAWNARTTVFSSDALRGQAGRSSWLASLPLAFALARSREISEEELRRCRLERLTWALESRQQAGAYWSFADGCSALGQANADRRRLDVKSRLKAVDADVRTWLVELGYQAAGRGLRRTFGPVRQYPV